MKSISIDSKSILDTTTKKPMSEVIDFSKEYVTTETDKDTVYKAGTGVNISSDNTISVTMIDQEDSASVEPADSTTAGIMKLYSEAGTNDDGTMTQESITDELSNKAPTNSPTFTGTPTAPTPNSSDAGSDRLATTAYVLSILKNNPGIIDDILTQLNAKAPLASPAFTGTPTAPTPSSSDSSTKLATTAFVKAQGYATTTALNNKMDKGSLEISGTTISAPLKQNYFTGPEVNPTGGYSKTQGATHTKAKISMQDDGIIRIAGSEFIVETVQPNGKVSDIITTFGSSTIILGFDENDRRTLVSVGDGYLVQTDKADGSYMTFSMDKNTGKVEVKASGGFYVNGVKIAN